MTVLNNTATKADAMVRLEEHPMAANVRKEGPWLIIEYPWGDWPVNGVRLENTAAGIDAGLLVMERHWKESFVGATI